MTLSTPPVEVAPPKGVNMRGPSRSLPRPLGAGAVVALGAECVTTPARGSTPSTSQPACERDRPSDGRRRSSRRCRDASRTGCARRSPGGCSVGPSWGSDRRGISAWRLLRSMRPTTRRQPQLTIAEWSPHSGRLPLPRRMERAEVQAPCAGRTPLPGGRASRRTSMRQGALSPG
jgi:hypothetical protein